MATTPDSIVLFLAAATAVGAVGAAIGAFMSARATRKAAEAQLVLTFLADYTSPDMSTALRVLRNVKAQGGDEFGEKWRRAFEAEDPEALEVDQARRKVQSYFSNALRLYDFRYVRRRFVRAVASVDGINIFYDIVEPLESALNSAYDSSQFERIKKICGRSGTGQLMRPLPYNPADRPTSQPD